MSELAERLRKRYYPDATHPYRILEGRIDARLTPDTVLLDAGCGRTAPLLTKYIGKAARLIGVELVDFTDVPAEIETHNADLARLPLAAESVDLIISRSVFEHLTDPQPVYAEFAGDPDVAALFAEALMNRTPWQLWDIEAGVAAEGADTVEILAQHNPTY